MQRIARWRRVRMKSENVDMDLQRNLSKAFDKVIFSKTHWKHASDICHECEGDGTIEVDVPRPHGFGRDIGCIDSKRVKCPVCGGDGRIVLEIDF